MVNNHMFDSSFDTSHRSRGGFADRSCSSGEMLIFFGIFEITFPTPAIYLGKLVNSVTMIQVNALLFLVWTFFTGFFSVLTGKNDILLPRAQSSLKHGG